MVPIKLVWSIVTCILPLSAFAQGAVALSRSGGAVMVKNDLPRAVLVLVRDDGSSPYPRFQTVEVGARSATPVPSHFLNPALHRFEIVAADVTRRSQPPKACVKNSGTEIVETMQQLEQEFRALRLEGSKEAEAAIEIATELAQLQVARLRDSLALLRNDPVDLAAKRMYLRDATPQERAVARDEESKEDLNATIAEVGLAAFAYSEAAEAKYAILSRDADAAKSQVESLEGAVSAIRSKRASLDRVEQAESSFDAAVVRSLDAAGGAMPRVQNAIAVSRACDTPPDVSEEVEAILPADSRFAAVVLVAEFNRGGRREILARRIKGTDRFTGQLHWPTVASQASIRVRAVGSRDASKSAFVVKSGRQSLSELEGKFEGRLAAARKNYKAAKFRAEGGDHIKAVILP